MISSPGHTPAIDPASPALEIALELKVEVGPILEIGSSPNGLRRMVPILGGTFSGPEIAGRVLPGGADWQLVEADGLTFVDAQYVIETADGVRIEVRNQGIRHGPQDLMSRIAQEKLYPRPTTTLELRRVSKRLQESAGG